MPYPFRDVRGVLPNHSDDSRWQDQAGGHPWKQRKEWEVRELLIHHTATGEDASPDDINKLHWERNFGTPEAPAFAPRITYHYLVSPSGNQWKCNATTDVTWHCPKHNRSGLAVAMIGNRHLREAPFEQYQSLTELVAEILRRLPIPILRIFGHRAFYPTACPGKYFDRDRFLQDVAAQIGRAPA